MVSDCLVRFTPLDSKNAWMDCQTMQLRLAILQSPTLSHRPHGCPRADQLAAALTLHLVADDAEPIFQTKLSCLENAQDVAQNVVKQAQKQKLPGRVEVRVKQHLHLNIKGL
jgi:hypothetical protein